MTEKEQFGKADQRLLDRLEQSVSLDFPNPERVGCPDSSVLRDLAFRTLRIAEVEPWLQHLSACSPCFQEFSNLRKQAAHGRRRTYAIVSIAAVLLFAVAGWLWMRALHPNRSTDTEILDLRELIVGVDQDVERAEAHPLQLHRGTKHVMLKLPAQIHKEEQALEVALLRGTGDAVLVSHGATHLEGEIAVLTVDLDVGSVQPGRYYLGIRHPGANWTRCPLLIV
jgi:hypothetical protein